MLFAELRLPCRDHRVFLPSTYHYSDRTPRQVVDRKRAHRPGPAAWVARTLDWPCSCAATASLSGVRTHLPLRVVVPLIHFPFRVRKDFLESGPATVRFARRMRCDVARRQGQPSINGDGRCLGVLVRCINGANGFVCWVFWLHVSHSAAVM